MRGLHMSLALETGRHKVSLVLRPFGEGEENIGSGTYSQQMCQYLPESIRILCHCTNKPHVWRLRNYKVSHYVVVSSLHVHDVTAWLCE